MSVKKNDVLAKKVEDYNVSGDMNVAELVNAWNGTGGFTASRLAEGVDILKKMLHEKECKKFLSFPACIASTGLRGVLAQIAPMFDVVITTCGTLDHDLARAWGGAYYQGSFDWDDEELHKLGVNRLGNVVIPNDSYGVVLEKRMMPILKELTNQKKEWGARELVQEFGKLVQDDPFSILGQCARHNVPVYVPGITDGAFGTNLMMHSQGTGFKLNILQDEKELSDTVFDSKKSGALMLGGGISKHHTIWWNQFKGGLDYAVYITTATQYDGSLSGARLKEAVSWGKIKEHASYITVDGDVTVLLPVMIAAALKK